MDFLKAWQGRSVLVTGGTGFIGTRVLQQGIKNGIELHNISRNPHQIANVVTHVADLQDRERLLSLVQTIKPEGILHLAADGVSYGSSDLANLLNSNVIGLQTLLEAATMLETPPAVIIAGSWFEYAPQTRPLVENDPLEPTTPYSISKVIINIIASYYAAQLPLTYLRLFSVYGLGEQLPRLTPYLIDCALQGKKALLTYGEQVRDYVYVDDAAESFWRALAAQKIAGKLSIINVGSGVGVKLRDYIETLQDVLQTFDLSVDLEFGAVPYRLNENMFAVADTRLLKSEFGWLPQNSLHDGLQTMVRYIIEGTHG